MNTVHAKTICIYSPWIMSHGGIETHLINISKALARDGWKVDLCVKLSRLPQSTIGDLRSSGVRYLTFPSVGFLWSVLFSKSVLYTNSQGNTSPLIWRFSGKRRGGCHHCHTSCSAGERKSWCRRYLDFITNGPQLVACSGKTRANILELNGDRSVTVLPYLAASSRRVVESRTRVKLGENEKLRFGFVGRLDEFKGIDTIIAASRNSRFDDICWHIHGGGPYSDRVKEAEGTHLKWHGSFDRSTPLEAIYGELDAVVLPSRHAEGSPLCLIEASSFGKPWVSSDCGGVRELVCSAKDHIVCPPLDEEAFFKSVETLAARIRAGEVDSEQILERYKQTHAPESVFAQWKMFLNDLNS